MTENHPSYDASFDVSPDPETFLERDAHEGTNVCRLAALAPLLARDHGACAGVEDQLLALGFAPGVVGRHERWSRPEEPPRWLVPPPSAGEELVARRECVDRWRALNEEPSREAARSVALLMLPSRSDRESVASAAVLWREMVEDSATTEGPGSRRLPDAVVRPVPLTVDAWRNAVLDLPTGRSEASAPVALAMLVRWRLDLAARSPDRVVRLFALAALSTELDDVVVRSGRTGRVRLEPGAQADPRAPGDVSTIVHGTWGWEGRWWRPGGDFHDVVAQRYRPGLYAGGAHFSWSGAASAEQRVLAGEDLVDWAAEIAPGGLRTLFGHSYGGEVAALASLGGARVEELVLLSAPVTAAVAEVAEAGSRIVDVRLRFDPVLALARTPQRVPARENVVEVLLEAWRLDHGATHEVDVWESEDVAARGGI